MKIGKGQLNTSDVTFRFSGRILRRCLIVLLSILFVWASTTTLWGQKAPTGSKAPTKIYAQTLVDLVMANPDHPGVVFCAMHVTPVNGPLSKTRNIACSDTTKVGTLSGDEEFGVIATGNPNLYRTKDKTHYKGLLPLKDVTGQQIGTLTLVFKYTRKEDEEKFYSTMKWIRNELKLLIPNTAELFKAARTPTKIYAQTLVDQLMEKYPKLRRCAMHVAYPGVPESNNYVIAFGDRDGPIKPGGGGDTTSNSLNENSIVDASGKGYFYLKENTPFHEIPSYKGMLPLYDITGQQIGMIILGWTWTNREDDLKLEETMIAVRDSLKKLIPSRADLFRSTSTPVKGIFQSQTTARPVVAEDRPLLVPGATIEIPDSSGGFDFLQVDSEGHRLLASHEEDHTTDLIDLDTNRLITRIKLGPAVDIAVDPKTGKYFVSVADDKRVAVVDSASLKEITSIPVDGRTDAILVVPKNRRVYVAHADGNEIWVIDADTEKVVGAVSIPGLPEAMVYDSTTDRIYLNVNDTDEVVVIDPKTNTVGARWPTAPVTSPRGLVLDSATGRVFVSGGGYLAAIDTKTGKVLSAADSIPNVDQLAFDSGNRRIYCAGLGGVMAAFQETSAGVKALGNIKTGISTKNVIVDPKTNAVWTTYTDGKKSYAKSWVLP